MKTDKNILTAFLLNLSFSVFELIGGILCGSVSIISDSFHDFCDAASIGISYFLEKKSKKKEKESDQGDFITGPKKVKHPRGRIK